jgi:hypothetical protein
MIFLCQIIEKKQIHKPKNPSKSTILALPCFSLFLSPTSTNYNTHNRIENSKKRPSPLYLFQLWWQQQPPQWYEHPPTTTTIVTKPSQQSKHPPIASTIAIIHETNSSDKGSNNYHNLLIEVLIRNDKDAKDEGSER